VLVGAEGALAVELHRLALQDELLQTADDVLEERTAFSGGINGLFWQKVP